MDSIGSSIEGEWSSLSGIFTNEEEANFMAQILGLDSCFENSNSSVWSSHDHSSTIVSNFCNFSQGSSSNNYSDCSNFLFPSTSQESYYLGDSHINNGIEFCIGDMPASYLVEADDSSNQQETSHGNMDDLGLSDKTLQKEQEMFVLQPSVEEKITNLQETSRKRLQSTKDGQKNKRNVRTKKSKKPNNNDEGSNAGPASSTSCSEDDSNASHEGMSSKAVNLNGKTRASRGAATDPQSLYARKRRERINERLRILQNLVPNGTKVDISTMLEEAVDYVKFLQLQIKLLSSDDLWMYAPIAYNGLEIGLNMKLAIPR